MRDSCSSRESHKSSRSSQEEHPPSQVSMVVRDGQGRFFFTGQDKAQNIQAGKGSRIWGAGHIHEDAKFWPILAHFGYFVSKLFTFYRPK